MSNAELPWAGLAARLSRNWGTPSLKLAVVVLGYAVAFLAAVAALEFRLLNTQGPDADASSGMYAFGDALLFIAVLSVGAIVPTGLALYFLRSMRVLWLVGALVSLAVAASGVAAAATFLGAQLCGPLPRTSPLEMAAALSVLRMLVAPLVAPFFVMAVAIVRDKKLRRVFLAGTVMEGSVAVYAVAHWFVGACFM